MELNKLTDEQSSTIADAKDPEEIRAMARAKGHELTDEELRQIASGSFWKDECYCPKCGSHDVGVFRSIDEGSCLSCGYEGWYDQFYH